MTKIKPVPRTFFEGPGTPWSLFLDMKYILRSSFERKFEKANFISPKKTFPKTFFCFNQIIFLRKLKGDLFNANSLYLQMVASRGEPIIKIVKPSSQILNAVLPNTYAI